MNPIQCIIRKEQIAVDARHPDVIELVNAGYKESKSVQCIVKYGTLGAAMDHMVDTSDEEDDDDQQFSVEDSPPDFEVNWLDMWLAILAC